MRQGHVRVPLYQGVPPGVPVDGAVEVDEGAMAVGEGVVEDGVDASPLDGDV